MEKIWKNNSDGSYNFVVDGKQCGTFQSAMPSKSRTATIKIENNDFKILRKGFWKTNIAILDHHNYEVLTVKPFKWYGSSYEVNYLNKKYTLKIGNNPLAEWSIYQDSTFQLAYALSTTNGKPSLRITEPLNVPVLFHFLLWYLIKPVIIENTGQDADIMLLTVAAIS